MTGALRLWGAAVTAFLTAVVLGLPATAPAEEPSRYADRVFGDPPVERAIVYGHGEMEEGDPQPLLLDLLFPRDDRSRAPRPVLIFAHGGAYTKGKRDSGHDWVVVDDFARRGFVTATIDYRLTGSERDASDDMQAAVRWFRAQATTLNIDPDKIVVMGSSSGAVMSMVTNFEPDDPGTSGHPEQSSLVAGGISIGGYQPRASEIDPGDPPVAMIHAVDDTTIPYATAEETCQLTRVRGNVCEMFAWPEGGHPPTFVVENHDEIVEQSSGFICRQVLEPGKCVPLDRVLPVTGDDVPAGWRTAPVPVTLSASDSGGSGLDATYYTVGADPPAPTTSSAVYDPESKPVLGDGERISYFSTDNEGNAEAVKTSTAARVDGAAPSTADDVPGEWRAQPVAVTLSAADAGGSGLARTFYTKGVSPQAPTTSSAVYDPSAKPVLGDGERIRYFSVDAAGNAEPVRSSGAARVDTKAPATADDVPAGWRAQPVAVTLSSGDAGGSGVERTHYTVGVEPPEPTTASAVYDPAAKPVLGDGERIRYFSVDNEGNAEAVKTSAAARVDGAAPSTADDVPAEWRAQPVAVTLSAADAGSSGVARTHFTKGASPAVPTRSSAVYDPAAKPVLGDGERIRYFSVDAAGNAEPARSSRAARVDTKAPATADDVPAGWRAQPVAVTLSAGDAGGSGVDRTYYTVGAHPPAPTTSSAVYDPASKPVLGDGERISYFSTDNQGNAEAVKTSAPVQVDAAAPRSAASAVRTTTSAAIDVAYTAADAGAGLERIELYAKTPAGTGYELVATDDSPAASGRSFGYQARAGLGDYAFYTVAYDRVGNAEASPPGRDATTTLASDKPGPPPALKPVGFSGSELRLTRKGLVRVALSNPNASPVSGTVRLVTSRKDLPVLGSVRYSIGPRGRARVVLTLSERARNLVRRKGELRVRVAVPGRAAATVLLRAAPAPAARR